MQGGAVEPDPLNRAAVLERFTKMKRNTEGIAGAYRAVAVVNEQFVQGNQWFAGRFQGSLSLRESWFDDEGVPRISVNQCQGLMTTWSALLNRDRRSAIAEPSSDEIEDIYNAEIANKFIEFFIYEEGTAQKIHQTVQYAFQDGTAGLKIMFDRKKKSVTWSALTIHSYLIDPVPDYHEAKWVIFENWYSEDEVADLWELNQIAEKPPEETAYKNAAGEVLYGVRGFEFWQKPTRQFPKGFYACIIEQHVVEMMEYPFVRPTDGEPEYMLPLVLMKVRTIRDSAYGITPMTDIVPLQRGLNENVSRIQAMIRQITKVHFVVPKEIADVVDLNQSAVLGFERTQVQGAKAIGFTQAGEVSPQIFEQRDYFRSMMNEVVGLNDVTVGNENRTLSGKAMENIFELDSQKNADASKSLEDMVLDAFELTLAFIQLFYPWVRQGLIANANADEIKNFDLSDIQGVNLQLQQASELDTIDAVKEGKTAEGLIAGTKTPADLEKARNSPAYGMSKRLAEELVTTYLDGSDIDVEPDDLDLQVFLDVVGRHMATAMSEGRREDWKALFALRHWVEDELAIAQVETAPTPQQTPTAAPQQIGATA